MKTFFFFLWSLTPTLRAKLLGSPPKIICAPETRYSGARPATMLTKPTKSGQPNKLTLSIMPTLPAITNKKQPFKNSFVLKRRTTLDMQKSVN